VFARRQNKQALDRARLLRIPAIDEGARSGWHGQAFAMIGFILHRDCHSVWARMVGEASDARSADVALSFEFDSSPPLSQSPAPPARLAKAEGDLRG
jgi:hypothetical protein